MLEKVKLLSEKIDNLKKEVFEYLKNNSIPLDERWETYLNLPFQKNQGYYFHSTTINIDDYTSTLNRYQTYSGEDIVEYFNDQETNQDDLKKLKEEILQSGYTHWKLDW